MFLRAFKGNQKSKTEQKEKRFRLLARFETTFQGWFSHIKDFEFHLRKQNVRIKMKFGTKTHHVDAIDRTKLERLIFCVQYHVHHRTHLGTYDVVGRYECDRFFQPLLEGLFGSLQTRLNHVAWHQLQTLLQVLAELCIGPVQVADEGLKGVELPKKIFWRGAAISTSFWEYSKVFFGAFVMRNKVIWKKLWWKT